MIKFDLKKLLLNEALQEKFNKDSVGNGLLSDKYCYGKVKVVAKPLREVSAKFEFNRFVVNGVTNAGEEITAHYMIGPKGEVVQSSISTNGRDFEWVYAHGNKMKITEISVDPRAQAISNEIIRDYSEVLVD